MKKHLNFWLTALLCSLLALGPLPVQARLFKAATAGGTQVSMTGGSVNYPGLMYRTFPQAAGLTASIETAMAATGDKVAMLGYAKVAGRAASKVCSAAGGCSITWRTSTVTWANGGTTMVVGIQGVAAAAGPVSQPNGTYGVQRTLTGGDGNVTSSATRVTAMTGGSGSSTISHGDLIAVVWDMTARAGADSVTIIHGSNGGSGLPNNNLFTAAAWRTTQGRLPNVVITTDDGTLITFDDSIPFVSGAAETFADATNPDERGLIFQLPWNCKVDALQALVGVTDNASDYTITLYSDPLVSPTVVASVTVLADRGPVAAGDRLQRFPLATEVSLSANTNYVIAIRANGTTNTRIPAITLMDAAHRALQPGGTTVSKVTRNNGSGAFTAEATPLTMYFMGVEISSFVGS